MIVADYLIQFLKAQGVDHAFMVSGGQMMYLMDAVKKSGMKYTCFHHEQAAAYAADAYARITGRPSLCLATGGPGGPNLVTGIVSTYQDSIPVIYIVGQSKVKDCNNGTRLRQTGFLEVDTFPIVSAFTKDHGITCIEGSWMECVSGRPGPVYLEVPLDFQSSEISQDKLPIPKEPLNPALERVKINPEWPLQASKLLKEARRPLILFGHGIRCSGAIEAARQLDESCTIPIITTQFAKDAIRYSYGHPGVKGHTVANWMLRNADVVLVMGCSLHNQTIGWEGEYMPKNAMIIHVDPDRAVLDKVDHGGLKFECDVGEFLKAMNVWGPRIERHEWVKECADTYYESGDEYFVYGNEGPLDLYEALSALNDEISQDAIILYDAGQPYYAIPQAMTMMGNRRFICPGSLAQMGWALPASIGAALANPNVPVVAIIGDGSFMTNVQELSVLARLELNVKIIVISNGGYASIRNTQDRYCEGRRIGSGDDVAIPSITGIAEAMGIKNLFGITREIMSGLEKALNSDGPAVIEIHCKDDQQILLPKEI
jgi:acetolactate synthase I/II/III large subunit